MSLRFASKNVTISFTVVLTFVFASVLLLTTVGIAGEGKDKKAQGQDKVDVCHITGTYDFDDGNGEVPIGHLIRVSSSAYPAHIKHGDPEAWKEVTLPDGSTACVESEVLADDSFDPESLVGGHDEILVAGDRTGRVDIFTGDGTKIKSFDSAFNLNNGFAVGDVLGDEYNEILVAGDQNNVVYIYDGDGNLLKSFDSMFDTNNGFAVGNVSGNVLDEILVAGDQYRDVYIYRNDGVFKKQFASMFNLNNGFAVGDVLGDEYDEILVAGDQNNVVYIYDGDGNLLKSFASMFNLNNGFAVGNVLGDSKDEILVTGDESHLVYIYDGDGKQLWSFDCGFTISDGFAVGDVDGAILGTPTHLVVQQHIQPILFLGEPPSHIDYIGGQVLNFSKRSDFYSQFQDHDKTTITTSNTATSDWNFGGKVNAEAGADFGIPIVGGVDVTVEASVGYSYNQHSEEMNEHLGTTETSELLSAENDDYLAYKAMDIDIYRYPVIGQTVKTKDDKEGPLYVQISIPRDVRVLYPPGENVEWYQPLHENGNIFSYPWDRNQLEDFEGGLNLLGGVVDKVFFTGLNTATCAINWTDVTDEAVTKSSSQTLEQDASITTSTKVWDADLEVTVSEHYDHTWGELTTLDTELSQSKGFTIEKPGMDNEHAYGFTALIYSKGVDDDEIPTGTLKLGYLVDLETTEVGYWWDNSVYQSNSDLALNLPHRWKTSDSGDTWNFNEDTDNAGIEYNKKMKGLWFLNKNEEQIGYSITDGDQVTVRARIYNYSFVDVQNVKVKLEAQESTNNQDWGERFDIGTDTIISTIHGFQNDLDKPNWEYAEVTFDTSTSSLNAGKYYRFWVTVDPDNAITEIDGHDLGDKYSNNEGYFGIPLFVEQSTTLAQPSEGDVVSEEISFSNDKPKKGEEVVISAKISTNHKDFSNIHVYFYEGDPDNGGKLFDVELIPYIEAYKSYTVSVPWNTYVKAGEYQIHAVVSGNIRDTNDENNKISGIITVGDGDDDNDDVLNANDECLATGPGEVVNDVGCSISDLCPCDNVWKNHGGYVQCVAHASEEFLAEGLITYDVKDSIVSDAGRSDCGHKE